MTALTISTRWLSPDIADVAVSTGDATLEAKWLTENERKQLAEHLREVADELSPVSEEI
jgi:hypothetical protein